MAKKLSAAKTSAATTPDEMKIVRANMNREVVQSPNFVSLYANDTQAQVSPWDIRIVFGVIADPPTPERQSVLVQTVGEVRMSPQHAKAFAMILIRQLKLYEETVGPIPLPEMTG